MVKVVVLVLTSVTNMIVSVMITTVVVMNSSNNNVKHEVEGVKGRITRKGKVLLTIISFKKDGGVKKSCHGCIK